MLHAPVSWNVRIAVNVYGVFFLKLTSLMLFNEMMIIIDFLSYITIEARQEIE